jgi:peptide/nickel transport system permease protein
MLPFIARRLAWAVVVMLTVAVLAFLLTFVAPGDPAKSIAGPNSSAAAVERIRASLGLDRPPLEQLASYLGGLLRGDLGTSYQMGGRPVGELILAKVPATLQLAITGLALGVLIGLPLGVRSALRRGGRLDRFGAAFGAVLVSVPAFLVGLLLIYVLAYRLSTDLGIRLFPVGVTRWDPLDLSALALPALTLALAVTPFYIRVSRAAMLEELHRDYVRTAHAKGLSARDVTWRHAFRNALLPIVTLVGLDLGFLLGGIVVIEAVFAWPGLGMQAVRAITAEDLPMLMGTLLFGTFCIVIANLVVDVLYAVLDPRVSHAVPRA